MKRLSLVLTLAALVAVTLPQAGQATTWFRTYGGSGWDEGHCVQEVEDGYIVTGRRTLSSGHYALWLLKIDTLGVEKWSKTYRATDSSNTRGNFVRQTLDGGYIVTGVDWSGFSQIWLLKTDKQGDRVWTKNLGAWYGNCVQPTKDTGYIVAAGTGRLTLIKTNTLGDTLWQRRYLENGWAFSTGYFVEQTDDEGYITIGRITDTTFETEKTACWILKTDSSGETKWSYILGGKNWGDFDEGRCVRQTEDKGYIALGTIGLVSLNTQGDTLWSRDYRNGSSVDATTDSGYILTGEAGPLLTATLTSVMSQDLWLFKTDSLGDSLWRRPYDTGLSYYVEETSDKGFIVTGGVATNGGDLFLLKTDSLGLLGITENPIVEADNGWNVPHSIGSYVVLHYQGLPQGFRANVFDVSGRQVDQIRGDGNEGAMTWGINQPPGVYFIQALDNQNQLKTAKVVLVR